MFLEEVGSGAPESMAYVVPIAIGAAIAGAVIGIMIVCLYRYCSHGVAAASSRSHVEPLLVNGQVTSPSMSVSTVPTVDAALETPPIKPEYSNLISLAIFVIFTSTLTGGSLYLLVRYFEVIWKSGFVAALLLGGIAFALQAATLWFIRNVVVRRFYTTMQLSRENKESTPVLEWFKVWLPRYMKQRQSMFNNVAPLFRKKDGTTFFTMFQDTRNSDQFALSLWTMPGTHTFTYVSPKDGSRSRVVMHYYTKGEMKKSASSWTGRSKRGAPRTQLPSHHCCCCHHC
jgi:hypothetical protein